jgi:hypothetical protein
MSGSHDERAAARKDADLVVTDLISVSGMLEEVAILWRRAGLLRQEPPSGSLGNLREAARGLADMVRALPDADCGQHQALAFSAVTQLAALQNKAARVAAATGDHHPGDAAMWAAIQRHLYQAGKHLWSLIAHLAETGETPLTGNVTARRDAPMMRGRPPRPQPPAVDSREARQALAIQRDAIDALPEVDLRRLLALIGGMDPAALQRAAATYTEMFCAVAEMQASVAALRPVALAAPGNYPQDP